MSYYTKHKLKEGFYVTAQRWFFKKPPFVSLLFFIYTQQREINLLGGKNTLQNAENILFLFSSKYIYTWKNPHLATKTSSILFTSQNKVLSTTRRATTATATVVITRLNAASQRWWKSSSCNIVPEPRAGPEEEELTAAALLALMWAVKPLLQLIIKKESKKVAK